VSSLEQARKQHVTAARARRGAFAPRIAAWLAAAALCCGARSASADPPADKAPSTDKAPAADEAPAADKAPPAIRGTDPATPTPDPAQRRDPAHYRGRQNGTTAVEALSWIPRVLFFPAYAVTELGLRRPIYLGAEWADRNHVVPILDHVFHPTPDIFWSPTLSLDLGSITFVGLQGRWRNLLVPGHELRASAAFGGVDAWRFKLRDRWQLGPSMYAGARGEYESRWDRAFFGLGPRSLDYRRNFSQARGEGFVFAGFEHGNYLRLEVSEGYRSERTGGGGSPSVEPRFTEKDLPGFGELDLAMAMLDLRVDSRRAREENGGVRFLANATYGRDPRDAQRSFITTELDVEGAVEVWHPDRVLAARAYTMTTSPLGAEPVPFTHLATLGGRDHHGFIPGRFRGESALLFELRYRYPIAYFVDAQWTASAGNVLAQRFTDLTPGALTGSLGFGLRTRRTGTAAFELTVALGTSRFDEPFALDSVRLHFGTTEGL